MADKLRKFKVILRYTSVSGSSRYALSELFGLLVLFYPPLLTGLLQVQVLGI